MADTSGSAGEVRVRLALDTTDLRTQLRNAEQTVGSGEGIELKVKFPRNAASTLSGLLPGIAREVRPILLTAGLDYGASIKQINADVEHLSGLTKGGVKKIKIPFELEVSDDDRALLASVGALRATASPKAPAARSTTPKRAMGGYVQQNRPSIVGERGPEVFVPRQSGTVIPRFHEGGSLIKGHIHNITPPPSVRSVKRGAPFDWPGPPYDGSYYRDPRSGRWVPTEVRTERQAEEYAQRGRFRTLTPAQQAGLSQKQRLAYEHGSAFSEKGWGDPYVARVTPRVGGRDLTIDKLLPPERPFRRPLDRNDPFVQAAASNAPVDIGRGGYNRAVGRYGRRVILPPTAGLVSKESDDETTRRIIEASVLAPGYGKVPVKGDYVPTGLDEYSAAVAARKRREIEALHISAPAVPPMRSFADIGGWSPEWGEKVAYHAATTETQRVSVPGKEGTVRVRAHQLSEASRHWRSLQPAALYSGPYIPGVPLAHPSSRTMELRAMAEERRRTPGELSEFTTELGNIGGPQMDLGLGGSEGRLTPLLGTRDPRYTTAQAMVALGLRGHPYYRPISRPPTMGSAAAARLGQDPLYTAISARGRSLATDPVIERQRESDRDRVREEVGFLAGSWQVLGREAYETQSTGELLEALGKRGYGAYEKLRSGVVERRMTGKAREANPAVAAARKAFAHLRRVDEYGKHAPLYKLPVDDLNDFVPGLGNMLKEVRTLNEIRSSLNIDELTKSGATGDIPEVFTKQADLVRDMTFGMRAMWEERWGTPDKRTPLYHELTPEQQKQYLEYEVAIPTWKEEMAGRAAGRGKGKRAKRRRESRALQHERDYKHDPLGTVMRMSASEAEAIDLGDARTFQKVRTRGLAEGLMAAERDDNNLLRLLGVLDPRAQAMREYTRETGSWLHQLQANATISILEPREGLGPIGMLQAQLKKDPDNKLLQSRLQHLRDQLRAAKELGIERADRGRAMGGEVGGLRDRMAAANIQKLMDEGKTAESQELQKELEQRRGGWGGGAVSARALAPGQAAGRLPALAQVPGAVLVGEHGPEVIVPGAAGGVVFPNHWGGDPRTVPGMHQGGNIPPHRTHRNDPTYGNIWFNPATNTWNLTSTNAPFAQRGGLGAARQQGMPPPIIGPQPVQPQGGNPIVAGPPGPTYNPPNRFLSRAVGRAGIIGGAVGPSGRTPQDEIAEIRSQISEQLSLTPVRALSVSIGQIFQQAVGGRAGIQSRAAAANVAAARAQREAGFLEQVQQQRAEARFGLRTMRAQGITSGDAWDKQMASMRGAIGAERVQAPVVRAAIDEARRRESLVSTRTQRVWAQTLGLTGIIGGTLLFSNAMKLAQMGMAAIEEAAGPVVDSMGGFARTANRVTDDLAKVARGAPSAAAAIAGQQAQQGISIATPATTRRAELLAGAAGMLDVQAAIRAEQSNQGRGELQGVTTGFNNGLFAGIPILGDLFGWIGQGQALAETFAGTIGAKPQMVQSGPGQFIENITGGGAPPTLEKYLAQEAQDLGQPFGLDDYQTQVATQRYRERYPQGATGMTANEEALADWTERSSMAFKQLNANIAKVNPELGHFITGLAEGDERITKTAEGIAAFEGGDILAQKIIESGAALVDAQGNLVDTTVQMGGFGEALTSKVLDAFEAAAAGAAKVDFGKFLENMRPALEAQIRGMQRDRQFQQQMIPANFTRQLIGQALPAPTTGLLPRSGAGILGGAVPQTGMMMQFVNEVSNIQRELMETFEEGLPRLSDISGISEDDLRTLQRYSETTQSIRDEAADLQLGMEQERYNEQLRISRRGLGDLVGLAGRVGGAYKTIVGFSESGAAITQTQVAQATEYGQLQRAQIMDSRQLSSIQLARSQRELNMQLAIARLRSPGQTAAERAVRREEAEALAREQQQELNINRRSTRRGFQIQDIDIGRQLADALRGQGLAESERTVGLRVQGLGSVANMRDQFHQLQLQVLDLGTTFGTQIQSAYNQAQTATEQATGQFLESNAELVRTAFNDIIKNVERAYDTVIPGYQTRQERRAERMGGNQPSRDDLLVIMGQSGGQPGGPVGRQGGAVVMGGRGSRGTNPNVRAGPPAGTDIGWEKWIETNGGSASGGGGGGGRNVNITINASVRDDRDVDDLVKKVVREIHEQAALMV